MKECSFKPEVLKKVVKTKSLSHLQASQLREQHEEAKRHLKRLKLIEEAQTRAQKKEEQALAAESKAERVANRKTKKERRRK